MFTICHAEQPPETLTTLEPDQQPAGRRLTALLCAWAAGGVAIVAAQLLGV